jgi:hypothetical protein
MANLSLLALASVIERPLPDGRAISGAIMPPLGFLSKAKPLLLRRPILRKCQGVDALVSLGDGFGNDIQHSDGMTKR